MIDIKIIRENSDLVKKNIKKKFQDDKLVLVDKIKKLDIEWRNQKHRVDKLRHERNKVSQEIAVAKKAGKSVSVLMKRAKGIPAKIDEIEEETEKMQEEIRGLLMKIPNMIHDSVPIGKSDKENVVREVFGKPKKFGFEVKSHAELAESLGVADFSSSARTSGNGFYYLEGDLALLNQALIRYVTDLMVSKGFRYVETPLMLRGDIISKVTDVHDQENMIYKLSDDDLYLIGTSEHSLIGRYIDKVFTEKQLPIKQTSYSMCFRKEIGSHGVDEKGVFRNHQFNKVEMVVICKPEESEDYWEKMKKISIEIFKGLKVPFRVTELCSGDLGDLKYRQVDLEVWSPRQEKYFEITSCSNLTEAQSRRLNIKVNSGKEKYFPHTLNNTAIATSRAMVAILENHQNKDGSVDIPEVLQKYMGGKKKISGQ